MTARFRQFRDLTSEDLLVDRHMHSTWSDGAGTVAEILETARSRGLREVAITDHIRQTSTYFFDAQRQIQDLRATSPVEILCGFEAKINDFQGRLDVAEECLRAADISIASVHRYPLGQRLYRAAEFPKAIAQEIELELSLAALRGGGFSVLGHPGGMSLKAHGEFPLPFFEILAEECARAGIAFDLNTSYHLSVAPQLVEILRKHNPLVSLGSDAHRLADIGKWLEHADLLGLTVVRQAA